MNSVFKKIKQIIFAGILVAVLPGICLYGMKKKIHKLKNKTHGMKSDCQDQGSESLDDFFGIDSVVFTDEEIDKLAEQKTQEDINNIESGTFKDLSKEEAEDLLMLFKAKSEKDVQIIREKMKEKIKEKIRLAILMELEDMRIKETETFMHKIRDEKIKESGLKENPRIKQEKEKQLESERREKLGKDIEEYEKSLFL